MPSWPTTPVPQYPLIEGFDQQAVDNIARDQPDTGPPLSRVRFTAVPHQIDCQVKVKDYSQRSAVDSFYNSDLSYGSLTFTWAGLAAATGGGSPNFKFAAPIKWSPRGAQSWIAQMKILRLP